jgi:hypothetical protein
MCTCLGHERPSCWQEEEDQRKEWDCVWGKQSQNVGADSTHLPQAITLASLVKVVSGQDSWHSDRPRDVHLRILFLSVPQLTSPSLPSSPWWPSPTVCTIARTWVRTSTGGTACWPPMCTTSSVCRNCRGTPCPSQVALAQGGFGGRGPLLPPHCHVIQNNTQCPKVQFHFSEYKTYIKMPKLKVSFKIFLPLPFFSCSKCLLCLPIC